MIIWNVSRATHASIITLVWSVKTNKTPHSNEMVVLMFSVLPLSGEQQEQWLVHTGWESCLKWTVTSAAMINTLLWCLIRNFVFWRAPSPQGADGKVRERWNHPESWYWERVLSALSSCQFRPTKCQVLCSGMVLLRSKCSRCPPADRKQIGAFECSSPTWVLRRSCCKGVRVLSCRDHWEIKLSALFYSLSGFVARVWDDEPKPQSPRARCYSWWPFAGT